jgi:pilus assembly protein Flp/PilA
MLRALRFDVGLSIAIDEPRARRAQKKENLKMRDFLMKLYVKAQIFREDNGQDLIEYALLAGLIALAATAGMTTVAGDINNAFTTIGGKVTSYS